MKYIIHHVEISDFIVLIREQYKGFRMKSLMMIQLIKIICHSNNIVEISSDISIIINVKEK